MTPSPDTLQALISRRAALLAALANVGDFRPGSLIEHFLRCGKPTCHCGRPGDPGHGPVWSLTRKESARTISWRVPLAFLPMVQAHVAEYKRFRTLEKELIEVSEQLADAQMEAAGSASSGMAKKGALLKSSKTPSPPKSGGKSTRS